MSRVMFANPIASDLASVSLPDPAHQDAGFPASNLLLRHVTDVFRSTAAVGATIKVEFDLGSAQTVSLVWLGYTNLSATSTWRIKAAASQAGLDSSPTLNTGDMTFWPDPGLAEWERVHGFHYIPGGHSARWWQVRLRDDANLTGYVEAARLYLSNPWVPTRNARYGIRWGGRDSDLRDRTPAGRLFTGPRGHWRNCRFTLRLPTEAEMYDQLVRLRRLRRRAKDLLFVFDIDDTPRLMDKTLYGTFEELPEVVEPEFSLYEAPIRFEEWEHP